MHLIQVLKLLPPLLFYILTLCRSTVPLSAACVVWSFQQRCIIGISTHWLSPRVKPFRSSLPIHIPFQEFLSMSVFQRVSIRSPILMLVQFIFLIFTSGILGIATDDFDINVLDIETRRTVRMFSGHRGQINDMVSLCL